VVIYKSSAIVKYITTVSIEAFSYSINYTQSMHPWINLCTYIYVY